MTQDSKTSDRAASLHRMVRGLGCKALWLGWPLAWLGYMACCVNLHILDWLMEYVFGAYADWCEAKNEKPPNDQAHARPAKGNNL